MVSSQTPKRQRGDAERGARARGIGRFCNLRHTCGSTKSGAPHSMSAGAGGGALLIYMHKCTQTDISFGSRNERGRDTAPVWEEDDDDMCVRPPPRSTRKPRSDGRVTTGQITLQWSYACGVLDGLHVQDGVSYRFYGIAVRFVHVLPAKPRRSIDVISNTRSEHRQRKKRKTRTHPEIDPGVYMTAFLRRKSQLVIRDSHQADPVEKPHLPPTSG